MHLVAWSCDGRRLASGSCGRIVSVFLLDKDRLVRLDMLGLACAIPYQFEVRCSINFSFCHLYTVPAKYHALCESLLHGSQNPNTLTNSVVVMKSPA